MSSTILQQLTEHVWFMPPEKDAAKVQPAVGVVCSEKQTILIDAGNSPAHAQQVIQGLAEINAPPLQYIIYTHHHWDHIFATKTYDVPVVAQKICYETVVEYARHPWGPAHVDRATSEFPALSVSFTYLNSIMDWTGFEVVLPSVVLAENTSRLSLDDLTIEIEHVGGGHAGDSTLVTVIEDGVMFMADCFYPPPAHIRTPDSKHDVDMLNALLDRGLDLYVDGHSGAYNRTMWRGWLSMV